jgi:deoxyribodipyrimidine photolyase-related protein
MTNFLLVIFPNQLFEMKYIRQIIEFTSPTAAQSHSAAAEVHILLWEHDYFFKKYPYHKLKLAFHRATMKNYQDELNHSAHIPTHNIHYIESIDKDATKHIAKIIKDNKITQIRLFNPIEKELIRLVETKKLITKSTSPQLDYLTFSTPYFLNSMSPTANTEIQSVMQTPRHDIFYKHQRIRYDIMVSKSPKSKSTKSPKTPTQKTPEPEGGKWSFDTENREKFPKSQTEPPLPTYTSSARKEYIKEAIEYVTTNPDFEKNYGDPPTDTSFIYPINHKEAAKWLNDFIRYKLANFGRYEDAMSSTIQFGYHSLLSALTNVGLTTPAQIIDEVTKSRNHATSNTTIPISSIEGFIRQVIGWREYCYYVYDKYYDTLVTTSIYNKTNKKKIPERFWKANTQIPIIDDMIKKVNTYAYSHHIERLMGIGNYLLVTETSPDAIYEWFQTMYIDAYDVFMVPNVYGMLLYAKAGETRMMTRPYYCSSNYLKKMLQEPRLGSRKWDEVMDALYYNLIAKHEDTFKKIYATASSVYRWKSFSEEKKKQLIEISKTYIG